MKEQGKRSREKESVLGILYKKNRDNGSVTLDELCKFTGISREKIRKIIHELAVKDKIPIRLKTEFPYGFYIKEQNI
jgi:DNA-directed RNA polymerase sigma subunit (sigma70/sigma32)